jgi:hypothetical protein
MMMMVMGMVTVIVVMVALMMTTIMTTMAMTKMMHHSYISKKFPTIEMSSSHTISSAQKDKAGIKGDLHVSVVG